MFQLLRQCSRILEDDRFAERLHFHHFGHSDVDRSHRVGGAAMVAIVATETASAGPGVARCR